MSKSLKVVFFGTPEFAANSLKAIHASNHEIVGVVTAPDKSSGRGQKIHESEVKKYAVEHHLPIFQPEKLGDSNFLQTIEDLKADIFVVVAFRMMPKVLFEIPPMGTFNLHASLLPDYRGAAPINYAIINGETKTGVTTFFINEVIDAGNILLQEEVEIGSDEDAGSLHDRLIKIGAEVVVKTLDGISGHAIEEKPQKQVDSPKKAFKVYKKDTFISWDNSSKKIYDFIRGLSPYPCAYTKMSIHNEPKNLKIYSGEYTIIAHDKKPGEIKLKKSEFEIYTADGIYFPKELQLEGKKRMKVQDFLNGFHSFENIKLENEF